MTKTNIYKPEFTEDELENFCANPVAAAKCADYVNRRLNFIPKQECVSCGNSATRLCPNRLCQRFLCEKCVHDGRDGHVRWTE